MTTPAEEREEARKEVGHRAIAQIMAGLEEALAKIKSTGKQQVRSET